MHVYQKALLFITLFTGRYALGAAAGNKIAIGSNIYYGGLENMATCFQDRNGEISKNAYAAIFECTGTWKYLTIVRDGDNIVAFASQQNPQTVRCLDLFRLDDYSEEPQ